MNVDKKLMLIEDDIVFTSLYRKKLGNESS